MRHLMILLALLATAAHAQSFTDYFEDATLRLDYIFAGNARSQHIFVDELSRMPVWYGRRQHLSELPLHGNGTITVCHHATGDTIYRHSFSTLFQEWQATSEAKTTNKAFQNVFLVPYPKDTVDITVRLFDAHMKPTATLQHQVVPTDILIKQKGQTTTPYEVLQQPQDSAKSIDIAFVAEGYTSEEMPLFLSDCHTAIEALFAHEPFTRYRQRFRIVAVKSASLQSGVSEPGNHLWRQTALGSHFDTFYSQRYLTTLQLKRLHDQLAGIPYEHIIILANTAHYGGGGIYNSYNLSYTRGKHFRPVVVHEFGHSFGGLGDEYEYGEDDPYYFADTEPWEPNLTTLADFASKWKDMQTADGKIGLYEGGGYQQKGVYRPCKNCRMRTNEEPDFCPVCQRALARLILFYTD